MVEPMYEEVKFKRMNININYNPQTIISMKKCKSRLNDMFELYVKTTGEIHPLFHPLIHQNEEDENKKKSKKQKQKKVRFEDEVVKTPEKPKKWFHICPL